MSRSPCTEADRKRPFEAIKEVGISKPEAMYVVNHERVKLKRLKMAIKTMARDQDLEIVCVDDRERYPIKDEVVYMSRGGVFSCQGNIFRSRGVWKPVVVTLTGPKKAALHTSYDHQSTNGMTSVEGYTSIQISLWKEYHGPTRTLDDIPELMVDYSAATDVVAYKVNGAPGLYNVAYVRDCTWICTTCKKEFKEPSTWAQHFDPSVELPYGDKHWHEVFISNRVPYLSPVAYRCGISRPCTSYTVQSLMDKRMYGSAKSMWAELLEGMKTNYTVSERTVSYWSKVRDPDWDTVGAMLQDRVKEARDQWSRQVDTWTEYNRVFNTHTKKSEWVKVPYTVTQDRRAHLRALRALDDRIVKRQGRLGIYHPESKVTIQLEFEVHASDTVAELKDKITKYRRAPPRHKQRLYIDGKVLLNHKKLSDYGFVGTVVGYKLQVGKFDSKVEEQEAGPRVMEDPLTDEAMTGKMIEYNRRWGKKR